MSLTSRDVRRQPAATEVLTTVIHFPGYGFYARFGPKPADWEQVNPEDYFTADIDPYEIDQLDNRIGR